MKMTPKKHGLGGIRSQLKLALWSVLLGIATGAVAQAEDGGRNIPFQRADLDGDGAVSADEAALLHETMFTRIDANDDDVLTVDEYMAVRFGAGPRGEGMGSGREAMDARKLARFQSMDADGDGLVRKLEFLNAGKEQHEAADMDKDGKVSSWEYRAARRY